MKRYPCAFLLVLHTLFSACDSSSSSSTTPPEPVNPVPIDTKPADQPSEPVPGDNPETPPATDLGLQAGLTIDRGLFLINLGNGIAVRTQEFRKASEQLETAARNYCVHFDSATLDELRLRFTDAMLLWQQLELFQMGPLLENAKALKVKIYGWPQLANYCKIDEESLLAQDDPEYELPANANRKGLQALEYLIFDSSLSTICPASNPTKAAWEGLNSAQKWTARCAYMQPVAAELVTHARQLETRWGLIGDNVVTRRVNDAAGEQAVLQELFNNIFYLDLEIKNQKLAAPAGQDLKYCNKTPAPCADKEELRFSHLSRQALSANFRALADIIFGFGHPRAGGLSAYVRQLGGSELANRSEKDVALLLESSEKQSASLDSLIQAKQNENCDLTQSSWLCQIRQSIKGIVADFKGEYAAVLKTQVPQEPQGDND